MSRITVNSIVLWVLPLAAFTAGCGKPADAPAPSAPTALPVVEPSGDASDGRRTFLDEKQVVPARKEWVRDMGSASGGTFTFRVTSQGPFAVTVLTDRAYRALQGDGGAGIQKDDVLLTVDSAEPEFEDTISVGPGSTWFIIQNQTDGEVEFHLQCFAP